MRIVRSRTLRLVVMAVLAAAVTSCGMVRTPSTVREEREKPLEEEIWEPEEVPEEEQREEKPEITVLEPPPLAAQQPYLYSEYRFQAGDVVQVDYFFNPGMNRGLIIRPDGMLTFPLLGDVRAAGRAPSEVAREVNERYEGYLANPSITLTLVEFGGGMIYVLGEVHKPGGIKLEGMTTVAQALAQAGGYNDRAYLRSVLVIRPLPDGSRVGYRIDLKAGGEFGLTEGANFMLQPYDVVWVPKSFISKVDDFAQNVFGRLWYPLNIWVLYIGVIR